VAKAKCVKCGWEYIGVYQGSIRGLCSVCTEATREAALDKGIILGPRKPTTFKGREVKVNGLKLFWWEGLWRVQHAI
jgi:hypothetical protein